MGIFNKRSNNIIESTKNVYAVSKQEKLFYFVGNGRIETIEDVGLFNDLFLTKDQALSSINSFIQETEKNHEHGSYKSIDSDHSYIALLDGSGRIMKSYNLKVTKLRIHVDLSDNA